MIDWRPECTKQSWGTDAGAFTGGPTKIVLHTTETVNFPGYYSDAGVPGMKAPHETWKWNTSTKKFDKRQHIPHTLAARALKNLDGGIQTNRDGAHQVELVMYCDEVKARSVGGLYVGDVGDDFLLELGKEIRELAKDIGCSTVVTTRAFIKYVGGPDLGQRMSSVEWDGFAGVCAHEHVPENSHQDVGNLAVRRAMSLSGTVVAPAPAPAPVLQWNRTAVVDFQRILEVSADGKWGPGTDARAQAYRCVANPSVTQTDAQERLVQSIVDVTVDGVIGTKTLAAMKIVTAQIQKILDRSTKFAVSADGAWGPITDSAYRAFRTEWYGRY